MMKNLDSVIRVAALSVLTALAGCGGGTGSSTGFDVNGSRPVGTGAPAPCVHAFEPLANASGAGMSGMATQRRALFSGGAAIAGANGTPVDLSTCTFDAHRNVKIGGHDGCGPLVVIDKSFTGDNALGKITIAADGKLAVPETLGATLELETAGISVAGLLSIGTSACPVGNDYDPEGRVHVTFTGAQTPSIPATDSGADKGIEVQSGGTLRLFGAKGVAPQGVNWTALSQPAGPTEYQKGDAGIIAHVADGGQFKLYLAADVKKGGAAGWKAGDWIVVATSSFSPFESEFVQIKTIDPVEGAGSVVTLVQPLRHYHFGGADPGVPSPANYGAGKTVNFGVDERSEVGLISRSITFTARTPATANADPTDQNRHWGGEIRILAGYTEASVQGVELEKFGKARLGSYPIHFHMAGAAGPHLIDSNSIHHSYNKCVTIHMTQGVSITNNVCARAVGHLFYQEMADEKGGKFIGNLGIGAMSHSFGIDKNAVPKAPDGEPKNWWEGDNLARANGYDGLNVPNMDNQSDPMHGKCYVPDPNDPGSLRPARLESATPGVPPCLAGELYTEQASGFWIGNPGTVIEGNSIAGCQGTGKAYWYVPPANGVQRYEPVAFLNNRAHACFDGVFAEEEAATVSGQLFPTVGGISIDDRAALNVISHFRGLTATRIRNRGLWVRPMWTAVENGRFATNRDSVTLVSSGGTDGNGPGVWSLMKDSVLVGLSTNNVDRWGPCPVTNGRSFGCVEGNPKANDILDKGYQSPAWNSAGYMIYDGPVRIIHNHFVNFKKDIKELLTKADNDVLDNFIWPGNPMFPQQQHAKKYEGDAALGWFQANQSAYPTATVARALSFDNVDLRHQIYTERVNVNSFKDGDKNTALIDLDGTLTGYQVVDANGVRVPDEFPISLNNLAFNRAANAVDECQATGMQDERFENRATSIISPANMASLEFEALYPHPIKESWQDMVFTKDHPDTVVAQKGVHESMRLLSRNGLGVWEPKVASGSGYTVRTEPSTDPGHIIPKQAMGMPNVVRVGFTDAVKPRMDIKPFHVRIGICYSDVNRKPPNGAGIKITRGYKSWGGAGTQLLNSDVRRSFNQLSNRYGMQTCINLDSQNSPNMGLDVNANKTDKGCPANGIIPVRANGTCPGGSTLGKDVEDKDVCVFPKTLLSAAASIAEITQANGEPASYDKFFFDSKSGMLFFNVMQDSPNATGVAPVGSCRGTPDDDPACPTGKDELETYFPCPAQGCTNYSVELNESAYQPGPSACEDSGPLYGANGFSGYSVPDPQTTNPNRLGYVGEGGTGSIVQAILNPSTVSGEVFTRWRPARAPASCPEAPPGKP